MERPIESVTVELAAKRREKRAELHSFLLSIGFRSEDEFYDFKRSGGVPRWQSETLLTIDAKLGSEIPYETAEDVKAGVSGCWDGLSVQYLIASLPRTCIEEASELIRHICDRWELTRVIGAESGGASFAATLHAEADRLAREYAEPGSEELVIIIESSYPR